MPDRLARAMLALALALAFASVMTAFPSPAQAAGEKVVIIVGPVGSQTDSYRLKANSAAAIAEAAGATVVKVYSPKATWANVKAAVNGADVIMYFGHGNGYPNPYSSGTEWTDRVNGWGLNRTESGGDNDDWSAKMVYCGEKALLGTLTSSDGAAQWDHCGGKNGTQGISPKAGFVMVYSNACYTPGAGEGFDTPATLSIARQRVANYSFPALKLGAGAYFATDLGSSKIVDLVLRNRTTAFGELFKLGNGYSEGAVRVNAHPDISKAEVWVQRTNGPGGKLDYWYAFAGNPARTPDGGTASYTPPPPPPSSGEVVRLAGPDRYTTAAAVSAASFDPGVPLVVLATGATFPDALAGAPLAALNGGPVLLVTRDAIPAATAAELSRLKPGRIVILGGTGSVGDGVAAAAKAYTGGGVTRIWGPDRYTTAAAVSAATFAPGVATAYVATGATFPDALAGAAVAARDSAPILLVSRDAIPAATASELARVKPGRIVILGGSGSVGDGVAAGLKSFTAGSVSRIWGPDRYTTAAAVSVGNFEPGDVSTVYLATGGVFPDSLAAGPVAGREGAPVLLTAPNSLPASVAAEIARLAPSRVVIAGGPASVSEQVRAAVAAILE